MIHHSLNYINLAVEEKKPLVNKHVFNSFISAFKTGITWLFLIALFENFDFFYGAAESFHFDLIDMLLSLTGFILCFTSKICRNASKESENFQMNRRDYRAKIYFSYKIK